jgi:hypothetical protein
MTALRSHDIRRLLRLLDEELRAQNINGELYLVGGAVMCLAHDARPSTTDVGGIFKSAAEVRRAAARAALRSHLPAGWRNDGVKVFLSENADFTAFLEQANLRVMVAVPEYLLAMKCLAMRIGAEFHDEQDVRFLLRLLDLSSYESALQVIAKYYPLERFPQNALYSLEGLLSERA